MSKIGDNIAIARKRAGLTQEELAARMGYKSKSTINKIELGVNDIPQSKIVKFAEVLGTTPAVLMGWVSEETSKKNDLLTELVVKMRHDQNFLDTVARLMDPDFFEVVSMLAGLEPAEYASIRQILSALGKK
jgi:transcriptional regulator with XRE-family HTH domain